MSKDEFALLIGHCPQMDLELIWLPNSCQNIISELQKRGTAVFLICININTQDCFRLKKTTENYISIYIYWCVCLASVMVKLSPLSTEWHWTAQPERLHSAEVSDQQVGIQQLQLGGKLTSGSRPHPLDIVNRR